MEETGAERYDARDKHIMVAVDALGQAQKAVLYVAEMLGGLPGFRLTLFRLIAVSPEEFYKDARQKQEWLENEQGEAEAMLGRLREVCVQAGFSEDKVGTRVVARECPSVAECIIEEAGELGVCTLVVGRRGMTMREEFLFGSTSNRVLHEAKGCAVWVVE